MHDAIAATVRQCHRLIIILSPEVKIFTNGKREEEPLCDNQNQLWYEHKIGLYDALTQNDLRVILVEIGEDSNTLVCLLVENCERAVK